jgi:hypothetical protein
MPICELCDRLTIARLKYTRLSADQIDHKLLEKQMSYYAQGLPDNMPELVKLVDNLHRINGMMWDAEHDIRKGMDDDLGLEEIGRRAIKIRNLNRERVAIKNKITLLCGQPEFHDCKMNHASSEPGDTDQSTSPVVQNESSS